MKYQVLTADKTEDVTLEAAQAALAAEYPDHDVEVHDGGHQFIAKLTSKQAADDDGDDEAAEDVEDAPKKKPPFLKEKDDDGDDDDAPEPKGKSDDDGDDDGDDADGGDKDDLGFQDPDAGESDVVKALKAVKTLEHALPKLKDQLKSLNGGDDLGADGPGPDGGPGGPPGPGGPGGPGAVPPPPPGPSKGVGPTPGAPPAAALPGGPPAPGKGIPAPNVNHGLDLRKGPAVGPSTFSHVQSKMLTRPVDNGDGTRSTLLQATAAIEANPRYANYYVEEVKYDADNDQWVAHLKSR